MNTVLHTPHRTFARFYTFDITTGIPMDWDEVAWDGPWAEAKKGRGEQQQITNQSIANAKTDIGRQGEQYSAENPDIQGLEVSGPGGLGTAASSYLANSLHDIDRNYGNARTNVARVNAQRGFAATPDATFASGLNSANIAQAGAEDKAYNDAQLLQRENTLAAINARSGLQGLYNPNGSLGVGSDSAFKQNQEGSTLGDIGKGISTVAGIAGSVAGLPKAFSQGGWGG